MTANPNGTPPSTRWRVASDEGQGTQREVSQIGAKSAQVVFVEETNVVNAVAKHRQALHAHPEGVTLPAFRVVTDIFQDGGMDHAATEDFQPTRLFANRTTRTLAENATDQHFGARLGKGEVMGSEADVHPFAEEALGEGVKCALQVGEGDFFVHQQPFHLMESG